MKPWGLPVVRLRAVFALQAPMQGHVLNGPMLRGAFGTALRVMHGRGGLYASLFDDGVAGGTQRPYRVRAPISQMARLAKDALLAFDLDLYGDAATKVEELLPVFVVMAHLGFGREHVSARLHEVSQWLPGTGQRLLARGLSDPARPRIHSLREHMADASAGVRFVSPVRLAARGPVGTPSLASLLATTSRRLAGLGEACSLYEGDAIGAWSEVETIREFRHSRREGVQTLSGVTGVVCPERPLAGLENELLAAACVVGVGCHTTMGMGDCRPIARNIHGDTPS